MDLQKKSFSTDVAGKKLTLETSIMAGQATSSVFGHYGDSTVMATIVMGKKDKESSYFPLVVDFEEKFYAVGKILGSRFIRREGRPSDESILAGRIIDRTIRPLFNQQMRREVQVVATVLSYNEEDDLTFLGLMTVATALAISEIPWAGPVSGVSVALKDGKYLVNPGKSALEEGFTLNSFVAGTKDKINMLELEGLEAKEDEVLKGFELAQKEISNLITFQEKVIKEIGKPKAEVKIKTVEEDIKKKIVDFATEKLEKAIYLKEKKDRDEASEKVHEELGEYLEGLGIEEPLRDDAILHVLENLTDEIVHKNILESDKRPDGRALDEVRELYSEVGLLKQTHGSALFIRGGTQSLAVTTIAPPGSEQLIEGLTFSGKSRFLLHYNFPPYSVGETGRIGGPSRRSVGHGALAKKAITHMLPAKEDFPYTIRVVSEILSSNGSSSMATVCGTTLSLMDAGVPIKNPVAGIAMGMITGEGGKYKVLTDIQGYEDHYGDTDLKVAGTKDGITAMQMDVKITGLTTDMLKDGITQAKKARLEILENITKTLPTPRTELSPLAPKILTIKINPEKIGAVIGPGGKVINGIIEKTGALSIDIEDDGMVFVSADNDAAAQAAMAEVKSITKEYEIGEIVEGEITHLLDFGAIVQIDSNHDGMIHVSELKDGFVKNVTDVVKVGDKVKAKIIKVDNGKIGLSLKGVK